MDKLNDKLREFLKEPRFAVVATINKDGSPQQTVVWYELQGDRIMMNTKAGRLKERNLRRDPRMSLCIEDGYRYLTIKGHAELDYDKESSLANIKSLAVRYHGPEKGEQLARDIYGTQERVSIYLSIEDVDAYEF